MLPSIIYITNPICNVVMEVKRWLIQYMLKLDNLL